MKAKRILLSLLLAALAMPGVCEHTIQGTFEARPAPADGTYTVIYDDPDNAQFDPIAEALQESGIYDDLAAQLSQTYRLPHDVVIRFTELGEENAYWSEEDHEITVGYELIYSYSQIFEVDESDPEAIKQEYIDAAFFTLFHEVGHSLVSLFGLPITGREEDAVDEFATLTLLQMDNDQAEAALISGIEQFAFDAAEYEDISELPFADEHSLDQQRFYQMVALVYGSDPERYSELVGGDYLPEDRAQTSVDEYERKIEVWNELLGPYVR